MVLNACRYFGHTREYWWSHLTWALYAEMELQLAENPPADRLLQLYFASNKWWSPPERTACADGEEVAEEEAWECPFPDVTE